MNPKWSQFQIETLIQFAKESKTFKDFGKKMGYSNFCKDKGKKLFEQYPFLQKQIEDNIYMIGQRFGRLIVLKYAENFSKSKNDNYRYLECQCDCGNIVYIRAASLRNGNTQSCGCLQKEIAASQTFIDLTGQTFGKLTVIKQDKETKHSNGRAYWWCKCSCGNPQLKSVQGQLLRNGHVLSCGCITSQYEEQVQKILIQNNIDYKKEYTFSDLIGDIGVPLRFDFAIFKNNSLKMLIEIQGQQHYKNVPSWGGQEKFDQRKKYDQLKIDYCKLHNIKLKIISYKDNINLKTLGLEEL